MPRPLPVALLVAGVAATLVTRAARGLPFALGARRGTMRSAARASRHARAGRFANSQPGPVIAAGPVRIAAAMLRHRAAGRPASPVPLARPSATGPAGELAVTWFGHSSALIELDGHRVLADPMWSERASPSPRVGPRRLHPVPGPLADLPPVDAVVISHDHYDHLDVATVRALVALGRAPFLVPAGVGAHLRRWGVPPSRVVELDWDEAVAVGGLTISCVESRHFSGRRLVRNTTQWSSWALAGPRHRVLFGGDTGFHDALAGIGERLGPFDLTLLPIGAYSDLWPDIHLTPEEAVRAHLALGAGSGLLVPVHWGTFDLGFHGWAEPVDRLRAEAARRGVALAVPRPGERVDATAPAALHDWWSPAAFAAETPAQGPAAAVRRANREPASTMHRGIHYYRPR